MRMSFPSPLTTSLSLFPSAPTLLDDHSIFPIFLDIAHEISSPPHNSLDQHSHTQFSPDNISDSVVPSIRRSTKAHKPPQYLGDYVCTTPTESICFTTLTNFSIQPPSFSAYCLSLDSQKFLASLDFVEPQTFDQATSHPGWLAGCHAKAIPSPVKDQHMEHCLTTTR